MQVISFIFIIANTLFTMYLSGFSSYIKRKIPNLNCDSEREYTKIEAYKDYMKYYDDQEEDPQGFLPCYCSRETSLFAPWYLIPHNFKEFKTLIPKSLNKNEDGYNYCA